MATGNVHRALTFGVTLLCQPRGRDQPGVAARVVAGAGLRLSPKASPRRVAGALNRLLADPGFRERARLVGARLRGAAEPQAYVAQPDAVAIDRTSSAA